MTVSKLISTDEFKKMISHEVYAENHKQQQDMKLILLKAVKEVYGERYLAIERKHTQRDRYDVLVCV